MGCFNKEETPDTSNSSLEIIFENDVEKDEVRFGVMFLKNTCHLIKLIFRTACSRNVLLLIILIVAGAIGEYLAYETGRLPSQYYTVLTGRDDMGFAELTTYASMVIIVNALSIAIRLLVAGLLAIEMRTVLTNTIQALYFKSNAYYVMINFLNVDNPDQRFVQDVNTLCNTFCEIAPNLLLSPFVIGFYTYKTVERAGWLGPVSILVFFVIFSIINLILVPWVAKTVFELERQEGYFRFLHAQIRTQSEQAAFSNASRVEHLTASCSFRRLINSQQSWTYKHSVLAFATSSADYFGALLVYFALGTAIFGGMYPQADSSQLMSIISETSFFFFYLINKCTILLGMAKQASQITGLVHRLATALEHLENMRQVRSPAVYLSNQGHRDVMLTHDSDVGIESSNYPSLPSDVFIDVNKLTVRTPTAPYSIIVKDLSLTIVANCNILITGPSGTGKTSFLRVLAGLWPAHREDSFDSASVAVQVNLPEHQIRYLPQRPYLPPCLPGFLAQLLPSELIEAVGLREPIGGVGYVVCTRALRFVYLLVFSDASVSIPQSVTSSTCCSCWDFFTRRTQSYSSMHWNYQVFLKALDCLVEFRLVDMQTYAYLTALMKSGVENSPDPIATSGASSFYKEAAGEFEGTRTGVKDWRSTISPGEQQRLALARLCFQEPQLAILDEATSQLSEQDERQAYASLQQREINLLSVGHRASLREYHQKELRLLGDGKGGWLLSDLAAGPTSNG